MNALYSEETSAVVTEASFIINIPTIHFLEGNQLYIYLHFTVALLNPRTQLFSTVDRIICCEQRVYHIFRNFLNSS